MEGKGRACFIIFCSDAAPLEDEVGRYSKSVSSRCNQRLEGEDLSCFATWFSERVVETNVFEPSVGQAEKGRCRENKSETWKGD